MTTRKPGTSGYSGTPLQAKLGIRPGMRIRTSGEPPYYARLLGALPDGARTSRRFSRNVDLWHLFVKSAAALRRQLPRAQSQIRQDGMIWVSWPKKASGVPTDLSEDVIRETALPTGLVDVKVCAVDEIWSGLKLVIRRSNRR